MFRSNAEKASEPALVSAAAFPSAGDFKEVRKLFLSAPFGRPLSVFGRGASQVDDMVLEYLLFRGFTRSFRAVVADCQGDRLRAFEVPHTGTHALK